MPPDDVPAAGVSRSALEPPPDEDGAGSKPPSGDSDPAAGLRAPKPSSVSRTAPAHVVIVDRKASLTFSDPTLTVLSAREFLSKPQAVSARNARVINLSRTAEYLGMGYYCSLLAEARGHRVIPSVATVLELGQKALYRHVLPELETELRRRIRRMVNPPETSFALHVFFGVADDRRHQWLARRVFDQFRAPLLKLSIRWKDDWIIHSVELLSLEALRPDQHDHFTAALNGYTRASWRTPRQKAASRYTMAVLHNPKDPTGPSDAKALQRFARAGEALGIDVELIEKKDYLRLAEYDALFIRETTALDNHTYRFARKAQQEGIPVIDDPDSILKCTNKVYLAELLKAHRLPTPKTVIFDKSRLALVEAEFRFPIVLKIPDGSSSRGVFRVQNRNELAETSATLFDESDLLLAQEFMYTEFDWRVGVLNRRPLYVSRYGMAKKHWKILRHTGGGQVEEGAVETLLVEQAPKSVVDLAVTAAGLIGDGLYGVDIKENAHGLFIIEINDNPSIDAGCEDQRLKDELYRTIMREFLRRMEVRPAR